jgi:hypothetical protein
MLIFEKNKNLPLIVVAAGVTKTSYTTFASHQYKSIIADPVLELKRDVKVGKDFNLVYLSSVNGLVTYNGLVGPCSEHISRRAVDEVTQLQKLRAEAIIEHLEPSEITLIMPPLHCDLFDKLLPDVCNTTIVNRPETEMSLLQLRRLFADSLDLFKQSSVRVHFKYKLFDEPVVNMTCIKVYIGDVVRCYSRTENGVDIFVQDLEVKAILEDKNAFVCQNGSVWPASSILVGLSEEEKINAKHFGGPYKFGEDFDKLTVSITDVRNFKSKQRVVA